MRKGHRLPQLRKVRVAEGRLKIFRGFPFGDVDKAKMSRGIQAAVQPCRDIAFLALHKIPGGLPMLQKLPISARRHFKDVYEHNIGHGTSPRLWEYSNR